MWNKTQDVPFFQNVCQAQDYVGSSLSSTNLIVLSALMLEERAQASMKEPGQQE